MRRLILLILLACVVTPLQSQTHEVGFFAGGSNYVGDIGRTNYIYPNKISGGVIYKYNLNPRIALRGTYTYIPVSGNDEDADNSFRKNRPRGQFSFSNTIHEFAAGVEFNFFEYNINDYRTTFTPYIMAEVAAFNYKSPEPSSSNNTILLKNTFSYTLPVGIGIKGRLADNFAIAFETGVRFTFVDDIDFTTDKINSLDFGGNGNDWYVFSGISIVYTFGRPPCFGGIAE
ncbi:Outer membrane protein beta-barrel domain-containing protein [Tenacibaculum sediminilitoris]|uniref:type IX secretion system protein PorG n=1 Tax=Tenacibaculum sediminilitoris TaxID=1820334 RepID=UPI0038938EAD